MSAIVFLRNDLDGQPLDHSAVCYKRTSSDVIPLTATVASRFVQTDTGTDEMVAALARIEAELAEVKEQLRLAGGPRS
jgi:hypothetical protein